MTTKTPTGAPPDNRDAGFTLIEMLVAVALFALASTLLAQVISTARMSLRTVEATTQQLPINAVQSYLRSALMQAVPPMRAGSDQTFRGAPDALSFVTSFAPGGQYDGVYSVSISLEPSATGVGRLVIAQTLSRPATPATKDQRPALAARTSQALDQVASLTFKYFGSLDDSAAPRWHISWTHLEKLPSLVAIDIALAPTLNGTPGAAWQTLTVPILIADTPIVRCPTIGGC